MPEQDASIDTCRYVPVLGPQHERLLQAQNRDERVRSDLDFVEAELCSAGPDRACRDGHGRTANVARQ
jgi:hypothetical protein